ncbi:MAG TPA: thioredoxin family protein [Gemmataceae bacterium]|jgi:peroxiredoxin|nr:thioredoxin family protein [Gemmataceae bacterium]
MRTLLFTLVLTSISVAGEFNKTLSVGDAAPAWKDLPGTDGKKHALADLKSDVVVVVFTCNSCATAQEYEDRLVAFANAQPGAVTLVAINVNTIAEDRLDAMKKKADAKKFPFTYLYDESQKTARDYGAVYTPEFFVLNRARKVAYMGAMDDRTKAADVKVKYLEEAVAAVLKGQAPPTTETRARGCLIRYKRPRD